MAEKVYMRPTNRWLGAVAVAIAALSLRNDASAQLPWESPQLVTPGSPAGLSMMFVDYGLDPNPGLGGLVMWRAKPEGLGFRGSVAQGIGNKLNVAGGVDLFAPL